MFEELRNLVELNGNRLAVVSMEQIMELRADLTKFKDNNDEKLSDYQKRFFDFVGFDEIPPHMKSVIIVAVPRLAYAKVTWRARDKEYRAFSGAVATKAREAMEHVVVAVQAAGFDINKEPHLPLKAIAVRSGLAQYGRNNIAYVDGMGSAVALLAFSTDAICKSTVWREPVVSPTCTNCEVCLTLCPTNAIVSDKFLIDSDKCLTKLNQSTDGFPDWVPSTAHHSTYYCLMCQARCPMNKGLDIIELSFDEAETARILAGGESYSDATDELKHKISLLTGFGKPDAIRNTLRALFDTMDAGHVPKL